jgi:hypothetical protein
MERLGRRVADAQEAVVAQDHELAGRAEVGLEALLLVGVDRQPLVVVVGDGGERRQRCCDSGRSPFLWTETATPHGVWVCITSRASSRAAWIALWMVKPRG